jgi:hypothetical protein
MTARGKQGASKALEFSLGATAVFVLDDYANLCAEHELMHTERVCTWKRKFIKSTCLYQNKR